MRRLALLALLFPVLSAGAAEPAAPAAPSASAPEDRWAKEMARFARLDEESPYPPGGVVFTGSSSIRLWNVDRDFPDLKPLNRGFGGSQLHDVNRHLDRVVLRHRPRAVVLYAGDNDLARGRTPEQVRDDFAEFVRRVRKELPETKIVYVAVKPSPSRWRIADAGRRTNEMIAEAARSADGVAFVDIWPAMLKTDGTPDESLFVKDMLHMNDRGYAIWKDLVARELAAEPAAVSR